MADEQLIDQALAIIAAAGPQGRPSLLPSANPIDMTPEQHLVHVVYEAVQGRRRGLIKDATVKSCIRTAKSAGIHEDEIAAAIAAAETPGYVATAFTLWLPGTNPACHSFS